MTGIVELGLAIISGGVITAVFNYFISRQKVKSDVFAQVVETWRQDNERLRAKEAMLVQKIDELKSALDELKFKFQLFQTAQMSLPVPMWIKDLSGRMLALNDAYVEMILDSMNLEVSDYIGKFDRDIWPKEVAVHFKEHDNTVKLTGKAQMFSETFNLNGQETTWRVIKYPRFFDGKIVGIAGIAIPPPDFLF